MDTPAEQLQQDGSLNSDNDAASTSSPKVTDSPKTPVRGQLDDSLDDYYSDELESPQFRHLIPVYNRRNSNDLDGVRIGWDDGYGCVYFEDDDYGGERNGKRYKRSRSGRLFTERHHQSLMRSHNGNNGANSPSPNHSSNNAVIQAELNDYLGCILSCLSAKKKKRQLIKASKDETTSSSNLKDSCNVSNLLNDSTEDEILMLCSQAVEKTISFDANCNTVDSEVDSNKLVKSNYSSIVGVSPLNTTNCTVNSNNCQQSIKKFKPETTDSQVDKKMNKNFESQSYTVTSNTKKKLEKETNNCYTTNTVTVNNNDSFLNDSLAKDDDLFSALDLSAIEQQVMSNINESASVITQRNDSVSTKQHKNLIVNGSNCKNSFRPSTSNNNSSSVLWRRCSSSSSILNKNVLSQHNKPISSVKETVNSKINANTGNTRYCTPAEIEEKRNRARRTLMLKFKSKNKSSL